MKKNSPLEIFLSFLKLGVSAFGGPAMVFYIKQLAVEEKNWLSEEEFNQGVALCQIVPGAIAQNVASYTGFRAGGISGLVSAFIGFLLPAFLLLLLFSIFYKQTSSIPAFISMFKGLKVVVVAIIANAVVNFSRSSIKKKFDPFLIFLSFALLYFLKITPFLVIISFGIAGIFIYRSLFPSVQKIAFSSKIEQHKSGIFLLLFFIISMVLLYLFDKVLFSLALTMSKIELLSFGGGYTALALMYHEVVEVKKWLASSIFMDGVALGQITPGPILITSAFVGYMLKGLPGAIIGTLFMFLPSVVVIILILPYYSSLQKTPLLKRGIQGILIGFVGLLLFVLIKFAKSAPWTPASFLLFLVCFVLIYRKINLIYIVIGGALVSLLIF